MERELKRVPNASALSDPGERGDARARHHGHGQILESQVQEFLASVSRRAM